MNRLEIGDDETLDGELIGVRSEGSLDGFYLSWSLLPLPVPLLLWLMLERSGVVAWLAGRGANRSASSQLYYEDFRREMVF